MEERKCLVCGYNKAVINMLHDPEAVFCNCPVCGRYEITEYRIKEFLENKKGKLASFLFYNGFRKKDHFPEYRYFTTLDKKKCDEYTEEFKKGNNTKGHPVHIDNEIIDTWFPNSFTDKVDKVLIKLDQISDYVGQEIKLSKEELYGMLFVERHKKNSDAELCEVELDQQVSYFINFLNTEGYIKAYKLKDEEKEESIYILPKGYQRIDELQKNAVEGKDVLVAMKFGNDTIKLREEIRKGILDAGYMPVFIDEVEHNELITPELLSQIRKSRFVVVDLTHNNSGAYFEEGYAMGLGKTVIQLCKSDTKIHFDVAQKNTIIWDVETDIPLRLKNRIKATID